MLAISSPSPIFKIIFLFISSYLRQLSRQLLTCAVSRPAIMSEKKIMSHMSEKKTLSHDTWQGLMRQNPPAHCHSLLIFFLCFLWHVMSHVTVTYVTCHRPGVTQDCDVSSIRSHISKAMLRSRVCLSLIDYINGVASWINGLWSDSLEEVWNWV